MLRLRTRPVFQIRRLRMALLASLLLHVLILGYGRLPVLREVRPLAVSFRAVAESPVRQPGESREKALVERQEVSSPSPLLAASRGAGIPSGKGHMEASSLDAVRQSTPDGAGTRGPLAAGDIRSPELPADAEGLRRYRLSLGLAMGRYRSYPAQARARGWQGRVELRLDVRKGMSPLVAVATSCGHSVLDAQARDMLQRAVAVTPLPENLGKDAFSLPLLVVFDLTDD